MAKNIELVRQEVAAMRSEVEDFANSAERVGGVVSDVLEYSYEESERAKGAEQNLAQAVAGVAERVTVIEAGYATNVELYEEEERAKAAEGEIRGSVESLGEDLNAASEDISKLEVAIEAETRRAQEAEQDLSTEITEAENRVDERVTEVRDELQIEISVIREDWVKEVTRATTAEEALSNAVEQEAERATDAETSLANQLGEEEARAKAAEAALSQEIKDTVAAVIDGAPETMDTLKEVATWIEKDESGAAAMAERIADNAGRIETLEMASATKAELSAEAERAQEKEQEIEGKVTELESKASQNVIISDNAEFNAVVKEMYVIDADLTEVSLARIYNGFNGLYGIQLYDSEYNPLLAIQSNEKSTIIHNAKGFIVVDNLDSIDSYRDIRNIAINECVHNLQLMPILSNYFLGTEISVNKKISDSIYMSMYQNPQIINEANVSTIVIPDSLRMFCKRKSFYLTGESPQTFTLGNFQALYIQIDDSTPSLGSKEELVEILSGQYANVTLRDNAIVLAARDTRGIFDGLLYNRSHNTDFQNHGASLEYINAVVAKISRSNTYLSGANKWEPEENTSSLFIPVKGVKQVSIATNNTTIYTFLKDNYAFLGSVASYATGASRKILSNNKETMQVPNDAAYLYVSEKINNADWSASEILFDDSTYNYAKPMYENISLEDDKIKRILGINDILPSIGYIDTTNNWQMSSQGVFLPCAGANKIEVDASSKTCVYAFLKSKDQSIVDYATGAGRKVAIDKKVTDSIPSDAEYLWVSYIIDNSDWFPNDIHIDGQSIYENSIDYVNRQIYELKNDNTFFQNIKLSPNLSRKNNARPLIYKADTKHDDNYIVNAVAYPNGVIIAARAGEGVVRINLDGSEDLLLNISASDWRCLWMDSNMNIYASPHGSAGIGLSMEYRGLYKLSYGSDEFVKVVSLYNPSSSIATESEENDDTIWTMCEDNEGNLYAGVYSHTKHYNPAIYKSIDGGNTWDYYYNFIDSGLAPNGHHVHSIIYNEYDNALYSIIGEINTLYKSVDGASTWVDVKAPCQYDKGSAMIATPTGILIGSDGAYNCAVAKYYPNGEVKTKGVASANTIFAFRKSDITGRIYAFGKIDSSVGSTYYFPPTTSEEDVEVIENWKAESSMANKWEQYNMLTKKLYPEDSVKPQHFIIMASDDDGEAWYVVYREFAGALGASGFWTTGYFRNGECLTGRIIFKAGVGLKVANPLVISDGTHRYNEQGISIDDSIYRKIQSSDNVNIL